MTDKLLKPIFYGLAVLICISAFSIDGFSQKNKTNSDDQILLFNFEKYYNPGTGAGPRRGSIVVGHFYKSGRIACDVTTYDPRGREVKWKKVKCFQISQEKLDELIELAEQKDFLEAKPDYGFFIGGADYGTSLSLIIYRKDDEKKIYFTNPRHSENYESLPQSLTTFLQKIAEIDDIFAVKRQTKPQTL